MPKISVYLNEELHRRLTEAGIPITKVCQAALAQALDDQALSIGAQLRRTALRLHELAAVSDTRIQQAIDKARDTGLDPRGLWGTLPWVASSYDLDGGQRSTGGDNPVETSSA